MGIFAHPRLRAIMPNPTESPGKLPDEVDGADGVDITEVVDVDMEAIKDEGYLPN